MTGTHINYYFVCQRKLYLFDHHVTMEHTSDLVHLGRLVHEESYERDAREIFQIELPGGESFRLDRITADGVIHEIKKSESMEEAHVWQLKFYLWCLKQQDIWPLRGVLEYPKQRQTMPVELSEDDDKQLCEIQQEITSICAQPQPPRVSKMPICKKCAYNEFCWG